MNFDSIKFNINGVEFYGIDTSEKVITLNKNLDVGEVIIGNDTILFFAKFKPNTNYEIKPACCCGAYTLEPESKPERGNIDFTNNCKRDLFISACNNPTLIKAKKKTKLLADESAMCMYKPCRITIAESAHMTAKYGSELYYRSIITYGYFHFLHGEMIKIKYNDDSKSLTFKLKGYL